MLSDLLSQLREVFTTVRVLGSVPGVIAMLAEFCPFGALLGRVIRISAVGACSTGALGMKAKGVAVRTLPRSTIDSEVEFGASPVRAYRDDAIHINHKGEKCRSIDFHGNCAFLVLRVDFTVLNEHQFRLVITPYDALYDGLGVVYFHLLAYVVCLEFNWKPAEMGAVRVWWQELFSDECFR